MAQRPKPAEIVQLFRPDDDAADVADEVSVRRPVMQQGATAPVASGPVLDLSDRPKVVFLIAAGGAGKTTLARWLAERSTGTGSQALFAAIDPTTRDLRDYFAGIQEPPSFDPAKVTQW